ncbi:hypothetical protein LF1_03190 [Rubripirellula obstinata]|uniref:Uncharacterized protein n=1 Tax=Rubripirellula obstinata TaxID=406547 RepID=A0A5B1CDJ9_9BACT|nr:hypothetical protein LF1_03190 [Rubripirellula obstinata]
MTLDQIYVGRNKRSEVPAIRCVGHAIAGTAQSLFRPTFACILPYVRNFYPLQPSKVHVGIRSESETPSVEFRNRGDGDRGGDGDGNGDQADVTTGLFVNIDTETVQ